MKLPATALSIASHVAEPLFAAGLVSGGVAIGNSTDVTCVALPGSTRVASFAESQSVSSLFCASDCGSFTHVDAKRASVVAVYDAVETRPALSTLSVIDETGTVIVAGDDDGGVHLFDVRAPSKGPTAAVCSILEQGDYIAGIVRCPDSHNLAVASGDGTLCVYDCRMPPRARLKLVAATPSFDDDLLSLTLVGGGSRAVAGTLSGAINVYNMKLVEADEDEPDMSRFVDRFYGHPESVSAIVAYGEDGLVLSGSSDGIVRVVEPVQKAFGGVLPYTASIRHDPSECFLDRRGDRLSFRSCSAASEAANGDDCEAGKGDDGESQGNDESDGGSDDDGGNDKDDDDDGDDENSRGSYPSANVVEKTKGGLGGHVRSTLPPARRKSMLWPIEGMALVRGKEHPVLAVIGHSARIRFCNTSVLDDSDDDDGEGEEKDVEAAQSGSGASSGENFKDEERRPSKRRKGKGGGSLEAAKMSSEAGQSSFFDGL